MYLAHLDRMIEQTILGQRYSPGVELAGYLVLLEVRTLVAGCSELEKAIGYLKHGDDKGDHIMIDDNGNVVSVIDWEWYVQWTLCRISKTRSGRSSHVNPTLSRLPSR